MAVNEQAEARMITARNARNKQNPKIPFLINIKDGRLLPNIPALAGRPAEVTADGKTIPAKKPHPNYRPFTGSVKSSLEERMKWLESLGTVVSTTPQRRPVTLANVEAFDVGSATIAELIAFAKDEYNEVLTAQGGRKALQNRIVELAKGAGAVVDGDEPLG